MKKRLKLVCMVLLVVSLVVSNFIFVSAADQGKPQLVTLKFDKIDAAAGDIINAEVGVDNISYFSGLQFRLKYDPTVLQPVNPSTGEPYPDRNVTSTNFENIVRSDILLNNEYMPWEFAEFNYADGIVDVSRQYIYLEKYRAGGVAETSGIVARIGFKVLKQETTTVCFEDGGALTNSINGTMVGDWNANQLSNYQVCQDGVFRPAELVTPIVTSTPTPSIISNGSVIFKVSKNKVRAGDIIVGTLKVKNISDISAIQANLKYDPNVLQPISLKTLKPYPERVDCQNADLYFGKGTILSNDRFMPILMATFDYTNGILNVGKSYMDIATYKASNKSEESGIVVKIGFKALKKGAVDIQFEETVTMPGAENGLLVYDWDANLINLEKAPVVK